MAFVLLPPFFLVRFGLLALLNPQAVGRAAHFAPLQKGEIAAYWLYQASNAAIFICMIFLSIPTEPVWMFSAGAGVYGAGMVVLIGAVMSFAAPSQSGINQNGLYRFSRHPMYLGYFLFFLGCVLLTQSLVLLLFVAVFQITAHWMIRSEERWCIQTFGDEYRRYMERVRRYI